MDACKTWLCICVVFIPWQMPTNIQLQNDQIKYTTNFMRLWNEGATIFCSLSGSEKCR
jgi:hypothetical protein